MSKRFIQKFALKLEIKDLFSPLEILKTLKDIFISIAILTITCLLSIVPLFLTVCVRLILKSYFALFTNGKYYLMAPEDSILADECPFNYTTMHSLSVCEGICNIQKIQNKCIDFMNIKTNDGIVGTKFRHRITKFFGYYCWENCGEVFDIKKIVRFANEDENSIFSEEEVLDMLGKLSDEPINLGNGQPQWEVLIFPNYTYNDRKKQGIHHYAILVRMHHSYLDGIAFTQRLEKAIGDHSVESALNPYEPINITFYKKVFAYLNVFLLGPYSFMKTLSSRDNSFLNGGKLRGPKTVGWTKRIRFDALKKIKSAQGVSIISILNCSLTGAMRKFALKKQENIPELIHGGLTVAKFPYEWMTPQNKFSYISFPINLSLGKVEDRLADCHLVAKNLEKSPDFLMNYWMMRIIGLFPSVFIKSVLEQGQTSILLSNVPGPDSSLKMFDGDLLVDVGAWAPLKTTTGIAVSVYTYNGFIRANFSFDGCILTDREDMDFIVQSFVEEIKELGKMAGIPEEDIMFHS